MADRETSVQEYIHNNPRKIGLFFLFLGGWMIYLKVVQPVMDAQEGAPRVTISNNLTMLGVLGIVLGLGYLIFGVKAARILRPRAGDSKVGAYVIGAILGGIGMGVYYGLKKYLESQGYTFH